METYGVSFDGFEPSCGWVMYKHTEEELIPNLKAEVERWRVRCHDAANERAALKGIKSDFEGLSKASDGLAGNLTAKISGREITVNDVMPLGVQEEKIKTSSSWQEL